MFKAVKENSRCCLCGKEKEKVPKLLIGLHGAVCSGCIDLSQTILTSYPSASSDMAQFDRLTRVSETIYYVRDLDQAVEFYTQKLGWKLLAKYDWGWAQLDIDGTAKIGLLTEAAWESKPDGLPRPRIGMQTTDIESEVARLKAAGVTCEDVKGEPGTMRAVTFTDLDGNEFFLWDDGQGEPN